MLWNFFLDFESQPKISDSTLVSLLVVTPASKGATETPPPENETKQFKSPKISDRFQKIIYENEYAFVPKGSIIILPKKHQNKVGFASGKAIPISWPKFQSKHKSFIHTVSLTKAQAQGTKASKQYIMSYKQYEDLQKLGRIVICTYNNTPVKIRIEKKPTKKK